jgi:hypothetical protein
MASKTRPGVEQPGAGTLASWLGAALICHICLNFAGKRKRELPREPRKRVAAKSAAYPFPQGRDGPKLMRRTNHLPRIIGEPHSPESRLFVFALANYDPGSA